MSFIALILIAVVLAVLVIIPLIAMARTQEERQSEFRTTPRDQWSHVDGALPIPNQTFANRLRRYRLVEDNPADATRKTVRHSTDASTNIRGILSADQQSLNNSDQTLDDFNALGYTDIGPARLQFIAAIGKHRPYCAAAGGLGRLWVDGVDSPWARLGRTECAGTAALDIIDVKIDVSQNGV